MNIETVNNELQNLEGFVRTEQQQLDKVTYVFNGGYRIVVNNIMIFNVTKIVIISLVGDTLKKSAEKDILIAIYNNYHDEITAQFSLDNLESIR